MADQRPVALVTGASRGIGRATALRLAATHDVIAVARTADQLAALAREIQAQGGSCTPLAVDVTDRDAVRQALAGIEVHVLVNNAGIGFLKPFLELSVEEWNQTLAVNLTAIFHVTQALLPAMIARRSGHIVIIGSIAGRSAFVGGTAYGASKHALMGLAESLMLEVRDHDVKVSLVNPGSVRTGFGRGELAGKDWALAAEDVADAVAWVVNTPANVLVHRVEIRANHPRKG